MHALEQCHGYKVIAKGIPSVGKELSWAVGFMNRNSSGELDFLVSQVALFANRHWARHQLGSLGDKLPDGSAVHWVGLADAAQLLSISPVTLRKMVVVGDVEAKWVGDFRRKTESIILPKSWIDAQVGSAHPPMGLRKAAVLLGLPVATIKILRQRDVLHTRHLTVKPNYLSAEDVLDLERRLTALGSGMAPSQSGDAIALKTVRANFRFDASLLAKLIAALLEDPRGVIGRLGDSLNDVQISKDHPYALHPDLRADRQDWLVQGNVAKQLGCSTPAVQILLAHGYLRGRKSMARGNICAGSVREFQQGYVLLSTVSRELGVHSRTLTSLGRRKAIPFETIFVYGTCATIVTKPNVRRLLKAYSASV